MKALVTWVNAFNNAGAKEVDTDAVEAFVEGLHACHARGVSIEWPEEPWTFGDLEVGDWFEFGGETWQKFASDGAEMDGGGVRWFAASEPVEPFEWEWVE